MFYQTGSSNHTMKISDRTNSVGEEHITVCAVWADKYHNKMFENLDECSNVVTSFAKKINDIDIIIKSTGF